MSRGEVGILGGMVYPTVLPPSSGHQKTYGWQVGGTHPTGLIACSILK